MSKPRIRYERMKAVADIDLFPQRDLTSGVQIQFANAGTDGGKIVTVELEWWQVKELREKLATHGDECAKELELSARNIRSRAGCTT